MILTFPAENDTHDRSFAYLDPAFWKPGVIDRVADLLSAMPREDARVVAEGKQLSNKELRNHQLAWVDLNEVTRELYFGVSEGVRMLNRQLFRFDLAGFAEPFQYAIYDAARGPEGYGWHTDLLGAGRPARKLSFTLQLSDATDYDGGDVELQGLSSKALPRARGVLAVFPSYTRHRVAPVTRGVRCSLVGWATGPELR